MEKIDFKKQYKELYSAKSEPKIIKVPKLKYLIIEGKGDPNTSQEYKDAIITLYPMAYKIKFICKKELNKDYTVMPLEGLWWCKNMKDFSVTNKTDWFWKAIIMQPDFITEKIFKQALDEVKKKKNPPSIDKITLEIIEEKQAAQIMHLGPYSEEGSDIAKLHAFIKEKGYKFNGAIQKHHEIYLVDPRKTAPEKLKTIIRQSFI